MITTKGRETKGLYICSIIIVMLFFWGCNKPVPPIEKSNCQVFNFHLYLSSLGLDSNRHILIGTTDGELFVFNPHNSENQSFKLGNGQIYCTYQESSGLFVGIRNEGLLWYSNNDFSDPKRFRLSFKNYDYSVYDIERYGDTLFCATSNGLCVLDLSGEISDSLTPVYPFQKKAAQDFQINKLKCIHDTLYYTSYDNSTPKLYVSSLVDGNFNNPDSILQDKKIENFFFYPNFVNNVICVRQDSIFIGKRSFRNIESFSSMLYCDGETFPYIYANSQKLIFSDHYDPAKTSNKLQLLVSEESHAAVADMLYYNGYVYWGAGKTLYAIPCHCSQNSSITALNNNVGIGKNGVIYKKKKDGYHYDFRLNGFEDRSIDKVIVLSDRNLCVLADNKIFIGSKDDGFKEIGKVFPNLEFQKFLCMAYDSVSHRLYMGHRRGFAYCSIERGKPVPNSLQVDPSIQGVQSILCSPPDKVYIGTLNKGCLKKQIEPDGIVETMDTINNIISIVNVGNNLYLLTPDWLKGPENSVEIKGLYIQSIFAYGADQLVGVSKNGGLYLFNRHSLTKSPDSLIFPDIFFYPNAIQLQDSILYAGTNSGLIRVNLQHPSEIKVVAVKESLTTTIGTFVRNRTQDAINFSIFTVLIFLIIIALLFILTRQLKKRSKFLSEEISQKETTIKCDRLTKIEDVEQHYLLKVGLLEASKNSKVASRYVELTEKVKKDLTVIKKKVIDFSNDELDYELHLVESQLAEPDILEAALDLELEKLFWWYEQNHISLDNNDSLKYFRESLSHIRVSYMEKVIDFSKVFRVKTLRDNGCFQTVNGTQCNKSNNKWQYYLDIWTICLLIHKAGVETHHLIDNNTLLKILDPESSYKHGKSGYIATLKKEIRESFAVKEKDIFKCKNLRYNVLYEEMVNALKKVLGEFKPVSANAESSKK